MCNLYSVTKGQQAIRAFTRAMVDRTGNLPPLPAVFPDQMAPVVRGTEDGPELLMMRWGFPPPPHVGEHKVSHVRQEAMHVLAERCRYTPAQVGQHVGNRDHTTVLLGIKAHRRRVGLPET